MSIWYIIHSYREQYKIGELVHIILAANCSLLEYDWLQADQFPDAIVPYIDRIKLYRILEDWLKLV